MKTNHLFTSLLVLILTLVLSGCAGVSTQSASDISCTTVSIQAMINSGEYQKKTDNFIIIQDASSSMNFKKELVASSPTPSDIDVSKGLIRCMSNSLPEYFDVYAGMRVFGSLSSANGLVYGMSPYSRNGLVSAVNSVGEKGSLITDLSGAINDASNDLKQVSGRTAVILFSDGEDLPEDNDPVAAAAAMNKMYGNDVCIYTIFLGDNPADKTTMEEIAAQSGCGFAVDANNLYMKPLKECDTVNVGKGMGDLVARIFLEMDDDRDGVGNSIDQCPNTPLGVMVDKVGCPIDSDGDGIVDYLDKCPDTPAGVKVDKLGCPLPDIDSDGDGVFDSSDRCPDTPKGIKVDEFGCPIPLVGNVTVTLHVEFDFDKTDVKDQYNADLEKVANLLTAYPKTDVELEGHTDSIGTDEYNMDLSNRRAASVKKELVEKYNIDASRISTRGYGESKPVASNDTPAGRMNNRRVEAFIEAVIEK
ncbi:OmpA family protein [Thermodesulfobacteriota bacterium]